MIITVTCPRCGNPIAVDCSYTGGSSSADGVCRRCSKLIHVRYSNDSMGFRVNRVD